MGEVSFQVNPSGIEEICKSPGMRAELGRIADALSTEANDDGVARILEDENIPGGLRQMPYGSAVDELDHTCVGVAFTRTEFGRRNEARHKSLSRLVH